MIVVLYDEADALKFLELKIICKKIIPLTPNSYSIIKNSELYEGILEPISSNNDEIHITILNTIKNFIENLKNNNKINGVFSPYYFDALIELLLPIISISTYLGNYIDNNSDKFVIINSNSYDVYNDFNTFHINFVKKISLIHQLPKFNNKNRGFIKILNNAINKLIFFLINNKRNFIFVSERYGLNNLYNKFLNTNKKINFIKIKDFHTVKIFESFFNLIKIFYSNNFNIYLTNSIQINKNFNLKKISLISNNQKNSLINNAIDAYKNQIIDYLNFLNSSFDHYNINLKKINPEYLFTDHIRFGPTYIINYCANKMGKTNILISHGSHSVSNNENSFYANYLNASGILISNHAKVSILQSPIASEFINKTKSKNNFLFYNPIMWAFFDLNYDNNKKNKFILHAGSYKILAQRPWMYETSNEYISGLIAIIKQIEKTPDIKLIIRFRPKKELSLLTLKSLLPKTNNYEISMSNSSTILEESLHKRIPVLLWGGSNRYKHLKYSLNNPNHKIRYAVYSVKNAYDLSIKFESIFKYHFNKPLTDDELKDYVWFNNNSIKKFIEDCINHTINL